MAAYTAQFGNGFSGTIAIEDPTYRRNQTGVLAVGAAGLSGLGTVAAPGTPGFAGTSSYGGVQAPDIVGNLRVDQA
jgi:hypothetical protein